MDSEMLRTLLFEYLKGHSKPNRRDQLQWNHVYQSVSNMVKERQPQNIGSMERLRDEDGARLKHVIWDLIVERVLVPSTDSPNCIGDGWPFLSLTDHGRKVIEEQRPVPYDPDGYLAALKAASPTINAAVLDYLTEAIGTFRTGNLLASAVMLGAASEMVFNELSVAIPSMMADPAKSASLAQKLAKGKMKERVDTLVGWCRNQRASLTGTWKGDEQVEDIQKVADLIRRRRNEAGHPEDPPRRPTREQMYSYLMLFPEYCKHLYILKEWAMANPGAIA